MSDIISKTLKKTVKFHTASAPQFQQSLPPSHPPLPHPQNPTIHPTQSLHKKYFSIQDSKFMSNKTNNTQSSLYYSHNYTIDPLIKLNLQINSMEDILQKSTKIWIRKLHKINKGLTKQQQKQIQLSQQLQNIQIQLNSNNKIITQLKSLITPPSSQYFNNKQNTHQFTSTKKHKLSLLTNPFNRHKSSLYSSNLYLTK